MFPFLWLIKPKNLKVLCGLLIKMIQTGNQEGNPVILKKRSKILNSHASLCWIQHAIKKKKKVLFPFNLGICKKKSNQKT